MMEVPLLRRAVSKGGVVNISPYQAVQYTTVNYQNVRLGKSAGFPEPLKLYNYRRGAGEAIDRKDFSISLSAVSFTAFLLVFRFIVYNFY